MIRICHHLTSKSPRFIFRDVSKCWSITKCSSPHRLLSSINDAHHNPIKNHDNTSSEKRRSLPRDGLDLSHFVAASSGREGEDAGETSVHYSLDHLKNTFIGEDVEEAPYQRSLKFHLKTYGCQMNVSDSDIVRSIMINHNREIGGDKDASKLLFEETAIEDEADILLTNTCAIRENAENKVWHRLRDLRSLDSKKHNSKRIESKSNGGKKRIIGVLGCMAERLKEDLFQDDVADLVVGPDAYRDLPNLLTSLQSKLVQRDESVMERAINVELSYDETYADITPVRKNPDDVSAFVSVMRGCNNMCSYCVVPFTRGRERSRELDSIVNESRHLFENEGVKEIVLLGQNVNSYHDKSESTRVTSSGNGYQTSNDGFTNLFKLRGGDKGYYFADLLDEVSNISPELRVRFTSPHPKDYPSELLNLMAERHNICNHLHMPAQSGSSSVLRRMRRGYTREAYLQLIQDVRSTIADVAISSDFIAGFCGEDEGEHSETVSLMNEVVYDQAYMFAYSMRGKTHASRKMVDDVPEDVKARRLQEIITTFRTNIQQHNEKMEVGRLRLVLVEGESRKSTTEKPSYRGRTDQNKSIIFPVGKGRNDSKIATCWSEDTIHHLLGSLQNSTDYNTKTSLMYDLLNAPKVEIKAGDYVVLKVDEARGHTLRGHLLWRATMQGFHEMGLHKQAQGDLGGIPIF